jgi:transcriptional regulator GlxA family with amidase domain
MQIAFLVFDGITPLDAIGPFDVLGRLPGAEVKFVGRKKGPVRTKGGTCALVADYVFDEVRPDILVVPGGPGAGGLGDPGLSVDPEITGWVREVHRGAKWTTSVCTGALILGGAGILKGKRAATHWRAEKDLAAFGAITVRERVVVEEGGIITAAGVSSGIDMALRLADLEAGPDIAKAIQLQIEYDPKPPFDTGSLAKATPELIEIARTQLNRP